MDKYQSNKLNSYKSVKGVLDEYRNLYENEATLSRSVRDFFDMLGEIGRIATRTKMDTTGETAAKKLAKEKLARLASTLAASGAAYAFETSNQELEAALDYTYTDIKYARDSDALTRARAIETELLTHKEHLLEYMISEQDLDELDRHIDNYLTSLEVRGGVKSEHVADVRRLEILFRETDQLLQKRLDRFVLRLQSKTPMFYDAYSHARRIVDLK